MTKFKFEIDTQASVLDIVTSANLAIAGHPVAKSAKATTTTIEPKYAGMPWRKDLAQAVARPLGVVVITGQETYTILGLPTNAELFSAIYTHAARAVMLLALADHQADRNVKRVPAERDRAEKLCKSLGKVPALEGVDLGALQALSVELGLVKVKEPKEPKKAKEGKPAEAPKAEKTPKAPKPKAEPAKSTLEDGSPNPKYKKPAVAGAE